MQSDLRHCGDRAIPGVHAALAPPATEPMTPPPFFPVPRLDKEGIVPCRSLSPLTLTCPPRFFPRLRALASPTDAAPPSICRRLEPPGRIEARH